MPDNCTTRHMANDRRTSAERQTTRNYSSRWQMTAGLPVKTPPTKTASRQQTPEKLKWPLVCLLMTLTPLTSLCSATYAHWQRGTARIRPPLLHLLLAGPTAVNLQQRMCCCWLMLRQTNGQTDGRTPYRFTDTALHSTHAVPYIG